MYSEVKPTGRSTIQTGDRIVRILYATIVTIVFVGQGWLNAGSTTIIGKLKYWTRISNHFEGITSVDIEKLLQQTTDG